MATTTNFGWVTPDNTDLVKDGAAAIRTLGSSIDSTMGELKGGTTGQVLSKTTGTDMDFTWVTTDDTNAIQNAIVDAKGDLIAATAADTPARLAVSASNVAFLRADSGEALGLKWDNDVWTTYTPTFTGFTAGNATITARYKQIGKTVFVWAKVVLGSTSSVTGDFTMSLPVNNTIPYPVSMGHASIEDVGLTQRPCFTFASSATIFTVRAINVGGTYAAESSFSSTVPQTWVTGDTIAVNLRYEAS